MIDKWYRCFEIEYHYFNKTSFSSEQDCKRTEQQELSAQKNRLEKVDCKDIKQWWKRE